ncbi:MAG: hypothetical protein ABI361_10315 [Nitrososphaera sp.]
MVARYQIKCKNCGHVYPSSINVSDKGADLDKLLRRSRVKCPKCSKIYLYSESDYLVPPGI